MTETRTKDELKEELRKEISVAKRLVARRDLAAANLDLSRNRIRRLQERLKTAPDGWRGLK